jgi:hypothetical protein
MEVTVSVFLYTADRQYLADGYKKYWFDNIDQAIETIGKPNDPSEAASISTEN